MQRPGHSTSSTGIMSRMAAFENNQGDASHFSNSTEIAGETRLKTIRNAMMSMSSTPSSPPRSAGVQTDADGLIIPKKLTNPCLESTERKDLHRELKFNNRIGKSVLNQKSELQRAYEKQKERHAAQEHSPSADGLTGELGRVIMERAQKHEAAAQKHDPDEDEERQYVNPEYLNVRAKLRTAHTPN